LLIQIEVREAPAPVTTWFPPCGAYFRLIVILEARPEFVGCPRTREPLSFRISAPGRHLAGREGPQALLSAANNVSRWLISAGRCGISKAPAEFSGTTPDCGFRRRAAAHWNPPFVDGAVRDDTAPQG
jgi:hypothetical protein